MLYISRIQFLDGDPMKNKELLNTIMVLQSEVEHYKTLLQPHDTGHIRTTISFITERIQDLKDQLYNDRADSSTKLPKQMEFNL